MTDKEFLKMLRDDKNLPKFDVEPIRKVLGELTPEIPVSRLGKIRLTNALRVRFGENYKTIPAANEAMKHFDEQFSLTHDYIRVKGLSHGRS